MPEPTLEVAKRVVDAAIRHEAFYWDVDPKSVTDEAIVSQAKGLIDGATTAAKNEIVAEAVLEIIRAAEVDLSTISKTTLDAYEARFGGTDSGNGQAPVESASSAPGSAFSGSAATSDAPSEGGESASASALDISDIFPGYDDLKVAEIKKAVLDSAASGDLSEEEWARIKAYEEAHEDRKTIRELQPEFKAPEPEPQPTEPSAGGTFTTSGGTFTTGAARASWPTDGFQLTHSDTKQELLPQGTHTGGDEVLAFYKGESQSRAQQEGLPMPQAVDASQHPPVLPIDITNVSDQELSRIATQFHSAFAYTLVLQSQEEGRERAAENLEHDAHHGAYTQAFEHHKSAIPTDKVTGAAVDNARRMADHDADGAEAVRHYRSRRVRHGIDARELKALAAGYDKAVWRINEEMDRRARLSTSSHGTPR